MTKQKVKMALGKIVVDPDYQVRKRILADKVSEYARAMERGDEFPPMVIEKGSNKIISGFTRLSAYERQFNPEHSVSIFVAEFDDDNERYMFAITENMRHGTGLMQWDRENAVFEMRRRGFDDKNIATTVNWSINRVHDVAGVVVRTIGARKAKKQVAAEDGEVIKSQADRPLKGGLNHLRGATIDEDVYENIKSHYVGWTAAFVARQLIMRIDDGTLNLSDENEVRALADLRDKLSALVLEVVA